MQTTTSSTQDLEPPPVPTIDHERRGRAWLIWSFVFCPCHLPFTMAFLAMIFGGTAFGTLISENTLWVGVFVGMVYAIGVGIGFRHLRLATQGSDCSGGQCTVE